ncbi:Crp/Fnr family transcriptional regulator [Streptomycetaceae bacterium NBC_01309]
MFTEAELAAFRAAGRERTWAPGEVVIHQGDQSRYAVLVTHGLVKVTADADTGYTSLLALRGPGELVGELACIDGRGRSATVSAMRVVHGIVVGEAEFRDLLVRDGGIALTVLRSVVGRLRDADVERVSHGAHPTGQRIARILLDLAMRHGSDVDDPKGGRTVTINQQELAGAAATSRESVVRTLRVLQREGLVSARRGLTIVHDLRRLGGWSGL